MMDFMDCADGRAQSNAKENPTMRVGLSSRDCHTETRSAGTTGARPVIVRRRLQAKAREAAAVPDEWPLRLIVLLRGHKHQRTDR